MKLLRRTLLLLVLLPLLTLLLALSLALQWQPAVPPAAKASGEQLLAVKSKLLAQDPRQLPPGGVRRVILEGADLSLLLGQGLRQLRPAGVSTLLQLHEATLQASVALRGEPGPWLNLHAELRETGEWPEIISLRVGRLPLPHWLARWTLRELMQRASLGAELDLASSMIKHVGFTPGRISLVYAWERDSLDQMLASLWRPADRQRAEAYNAELVRLATGFQQGMSVSLAELLPPMMKLAQQRSLGAPVADAGRENLSALLTLALHASGQHWSRLLPVARSWPRAKPFLVILGGRDDFAQHFLISSVIALEGGGPLADAIGIYKEMADSQGGSGFSFNDIAADRAGTELGLLAAREPARLQALLLKPGLTEFDFMPAVFDLPEFLTDSEFKSRYGGVGGTGYQRMIQDINARVAALPLYR